MIFLNHCGVSRMHPLALAAAEEQLRLQAQKGALMFAGFVDPVELFRQAAGKLFSVSPENISYVRNTSEGLGLIALGFPFEPGDEILSYENEYPANHYPWRLMEQRGAKLVLVPNRTYGEITGRDEPGVSTCGFRLEDFESRITSKTRIVAVSHVQFPSGYTADLAALGALCRGRGIDLVVDAAQSTGLLALEPEKLGISALASSGWKWLMGPVGTGVLYTAPDFREKIRIVMAGADLMRQGFDYLDHTWNPFLDGRKFEYSTHDFAGPAALAAMMNEAANRGIRAVQEYAFRLQDVFLSRLDQEKMKPLLFPLRSGILSLVPARGSADEIAKQLTAQGIVVSPRAGYVRVGAHYVNTEEDVVAAAEALNRAV